jgi:DNA-binding LacI/PurR family transcriptional regulator
MGIKVKDLANLLNLSSSTVSLVLNNKPGISEVTRNRVHQAIKELGYEELFIDEKREKKNYLFIVYRKYGTEPAGSPYISHFFSEIIEGVESQIKARGYNLRISYIDEKSVKEEIDKIRDEKVEGILILATDMAEEKMNAFEDIKVPLLIIDNYMEHKNFNCITINNEKGVYEAVKHLVDMGHNRIGYFHIVKNARNFSERYFGYLRAVEICGMNIEREHIFELKTYGSDSVYRELKNLLKDKENLPTAFFADNDIVAICAVRVFRELGYKIPEDISIIGFDNMELSEMTDPPLTTIHIPKHTLGVIAANTIIDTKIEHGGILKIEVGTSLIIRKSVSSLK